MAERFLENEDGTEFDAAPLLVCELSEHERIVMSYATTTLQTFGPHFNQLDHVRQINYDGSITGIPLSRFDEEIVEELKAKFASSNNPIPSKEVIKWYDEMHLPFDKDEKPEDKYSMAHSLGYIAAGGAALLAINLIWGKPKEASQLH